MKGSSSKPTPRTSPKKVKRSVTPPPLRREHTRSRAPGVAGQGAGRRRRGRVRRRPVCDTLDGSASRPPGSRTRCRKAGWRRSAARCGAPIPDGEGKRRARGFPQLRSSPGWREACWTPGMRRAPRSAKYVRREPEKPLRGGRSVDPSSGPRWAIRRRPESKKSRKARSRSRLRAHRTAKIWPRTSP